MGRWLAFLFLEDGWSRRAGPLAFSGGDGMVCWWCGGFCSAASARGVIKARRMGGGAPPNSKAITANLTSFSELKPTAHPNQIFFLFWVESVPPWGAGGGEASDCLPAYLVSIVVLHTRDRPIESHRTRVVGFYGFHERRVIIRTFYNFFLSIVASSAFHCIFSHFF